MGCTKMNYSISDWSQMHFSPKELLHLLTYHKHLSPPELAYASKTGKLFLIRCKRSTETLCSNGYRDDSHFPLAQQTEGAESNVNLFTAAEELTVASDWTAKSYYQFLRGCEKNQHCSLCLKVQLSGLKASQLMYTLSHDSRNLFLEGRKCTWGGGEDRKVHILLGGWRWEGVWYAIIEGVP